MDIQISDQAKEKIQQFLEGEEHKLVRLSIVGSKADAFEHKLYLENEVDEDRDQILEKDGYGIVIDDKTAKNIDGAQIEWVEEVHGSGFDVKNPNKPQNNLSEPVASRVQELLDHEINPGVASHGGHIQLVRYETGKVFLEMTGGCQGCSQSAVTLKEGVEKRIKQVIPEIQEVVDVTDHQVGDNPYYT